MKKIHRVFLQYLLDHQNPSDNYANRFFILEKKLINRRFIPRRKKTIHNIRARLERSGLIATSNFGLLCVTNQGIKYLQEENQGTVLTLLEKFTRYFNKKLVAIISVSALVVGIWGLINSQSAIITNIAQSVTVVFHGRILTPNATVIFVLLYKQFLGCFITNTLSWASVHFLSY